MQYRRSMIADNSTSAGLFGDLDDDIESADKANGRRSSSTSQLSSTGRLFVDANIKFNEDERSSRRDNNHKLSKLHPSWFNQKRRSSKTVLIVGNGEVVSRPLDRKIGLLLGDEDYNPSEQSQAIDEEQDYDEELEEEDEEDETSEDEQNQPESDPTGSSVLDMLQTFVESELYGKSRAMIRRQKDSMIDNSKQESSSKSSFKVTQPK